MSLLAFSDSESNVMQLFNTNNTGTESVHSALVQWHKQQLTIFKKAGAACLTLVANKPNTKKLIYFLRQRSSY